MQTYRMVAPASSSNCTAGAVLPAGLCVSSHVGLPKPVRCPEICSSTGAKNHTVWGTPEGGDMH